MQKELPKNEKELQETLKHCGFCDMWNDYHHTCSISGEPKEYYSKKCSFYKLDKDLEKKYREFVKQNCKNFEGEENMKKTVFLLVNIPCVGINLFRTIRGIYTTEEQALKNVKDDGDMIIEIPLDCDDDGKVLYAGWYARTETKEESLKRLTKLNKEKKHANKCSFMVE